MKRMARRQCLKSIALGAALISTDSHPFFAKTSLVGLESSAAFRNVTRTKMRLQPRSSVSIHSSHLSVGFETLDRKMFDPERTYTYLAQLGVKWARCQTGWARTERHQGEFDFSWLDSAVDALIKRGIQPWFNVGYGNPLYIPGAGRFAVGWVPIYSQKARTAWVRYIDHLALHFKDRIKYWEIWNEPNGHGFWRPGNPNPEDYTSLVKLTAPVIRRHVPGAMIVGGAFAGVPFDYCRRCFESGLAQHVDRISFHPYRARPEENYYSDVHALRGLIHRYKPSIKLWQGEDGAPSTEGCVGAISNLQWTEAAQARWLLRRLLTDLSLDFELTSYMGIVDLQNYIWSSGRTHETVCQGVLRGGGYTPKPSYYAFQNLCALFDSDTKLAPLLLRLNRPTHGIAEMAICSACFVRRNRPVYAYWYPSDLQEQWSPGRVDITTWSEKGILLNNVVIVDLLTGETSRPSNVKKHGGFVSLEGMPLEDYPMLITDETIIR